MRTNALLSLAFLTVAGAALAGCGEEPIPENVSYARDIKPLMEARCIRCHGAGGKMNADPSLPAWFVAKYGAAPKASDFTRLDSGGGFPGLSALAVGNGALIKPYLVPVKADPMAMPPAPAVPYLMPPPPAPGLTSRERDMFFAWLANQLP